MKRNSIILIVIICIAALCFAGCYTQLQPQEQTSATVPAEATAKLNAQESTLTVNATETVNAVPDIAYVYLGVNVKGETAEAAQQEAAKLANSFLDAIKKEGVAEDDIETSNISIYQDYENPNLYTADNSYKVTIREIDNAGSIIDTAISAGANTSYSLSFGLADQDSVYIEALGKAMQSIGAKAEAVAKAGGYTIVRPLSIEEGSTGGYYEIMAEEAMAVADDAAASAAPIAPGEISVSASVTGQYVIE